MLYKKAKIYKEYGIVYKRGKLLSPVGWVNPMLINGNHKVGSGVWTFSTLPGTLYYDFTFDGQPYSVKGTCPCNCPGCYAMAGFYKTYSVKVALGIRTVLARGFIDWLQRAIMAQIKADHIKLLRIHAAGDFFNREYIDMWRAIAMAFPGAVIWTYTKYSPAEKAFDDVSNVHIVPSIIPGKGLNYGTCAHVLGLYWYLKEIGASVYICRCGFDKTQHCNNCTGCTKNTFVLFLEHSTKYKPELDPLYPVLCEIVNGQPAQLLAA